MRLRHTTFGMIFVLAAGITGIAAMTAFVLGEGDMGVALNTFMILCFAIAANNQEIAR
jgi:hypothetical protein